MKAFMKSLFGVALALVVLGVLAFLLQPGPPALECVPDNGPSSGFVDEEQNCPVSIESYDTYSDYQSKPKPFRIAGLLLVVAGVVVGIVAVVRRSRSSGQGSSA